MAVREPTPGTDPDGRYLEQLLAPPIPLPSLWPNCNGDTVQLNFLPAAQGNKVPLILWEQLPFNAGVTSSPAHPSHPFYIITKRKTFPSRNC